MQHNQKTAEPDECSKPNHEEATDVQLNATQPLLQEPRDENVARAFKRSSKSVEQRAKIREQNRELWLYKMLQPKSAFSILHELNLLKPPNFRIESYGGMSKVSIIYNNVHYEAIKSWNENTMTKAYEELLREIIIGEMFNRSQQEEANMTDVAETASSQPPVSPSSCGSANERGIDQDSNNAMDALNSNVPDRLQIHQVAAFALFKLFQQWQGQGLDVPTNPANAAGSFHGTKYCKLQPPPPKKIKTAADLPPNAATINPAKLLHAMRPNLVYQDLSESNNNAYTCEIIVDRMLFIGRADSKRAAKRAAAAEACEMLFDVKFDESVL